MSKNSFSGDHGVSLLPIEATESNTFTNHQGEKK